MRIRVFISLLVCRFSGFLLRLAGRGGTNLPGRIALKLCPRVLEAMSIGVSVVIVTGTNGKTTTSRMLEECFKRAGLSCFANRSGANLLSGIVAEFARNCSLSGRCKKPYAIIECDEAAFRQVSRQLSAKCILVTNVFRDQLDRFGEITHTLESIREAVENSPQAVVCLNADCSLTASLAENLPNWIVWYGLDEPVYGERAEELSDAVYCLRCKSPYSYDYRTYGHLGAWKCPGCGWERPSPDVSVMHIAGMNEDGSEIDIKYSDNVYHASVALPGGYNIYNAAAAFSAAVTMGVEPETIVDSLGGFECGFGRAEKFKVGDASVRMMLVKNPAGFNQVLSFLINTDVKAKLVFLLNDRYADGTDISWIWDVDFERLAACRHAFGEVYVSGIRAYDMGLRLKYAGFPVDEINIIQDYDELIHLAIKDGGQVYMLPTYTAMFDLRLALGKLIDVRNFWE